MTRRRIGRRRDLYGVAMLLTLSGCEADHDPISVASQVVRALRR